MEKNKMNGYDECYDKILKFLYRLRKDYDDYVFAEALCDAITDEWGELVEISH